MLQLAARGDSRPSKNNHNRSGRERRLNRRVEVALLSLSKAREKAIQDRKRGR